MASSELQQNVAPFIDYGRAVVEGLPQFLEDIDLGELLYQGETHLLINLREHLSGQAHGDQQADTGKYEVPNIGFAKNIDWAKRSGIWTPQASISYPNPLDVDPDKALGLSIPDLADERVVMTEAEKNADTIVVIGALFDGSLRRVQAVKEMLDDGAQANRIIFLTGLRETKPAEGNSERYKSYDSLGNELPIEELFPTEYEQVNAIFQTDFPGIEKTSVVRDNSAEGELRNNEARTIYKIPATNYGREIEVIVMNGMPVIERDAVNRPKNVANPRAPLTFEEYLRTYGVTQSEMLYVSSYPHRNRIAIEGIMKVIDMGLGESIKIYPQGKMTWPEKVTAGLFAGEVEPMMRLTRQLVEKVDLPGTTIPRTADVVEQYLR